MTEKEGDAMLHLEEIRLFPDRYPTRDHYPFKIKVLQETRKLTLHFSCNLLRRGKRHGKVDPLGGSGPQVLHPHLARSREDAV